METKEFFPEGWKVDHNLITKEDLVNSLQTGEILEAKVQRCDLQCNLHFQFENGLTGIIPKQKVELEDGKKENPKKYFGKVNKVLQFVVTDVNQADDTQFFLSRVEVEDQVKKWIQEDLQEGQILNGIVRSMKPYGVFVEIAGGVVGLLHIEDISIGRIREPEERFSIGQKIKVMVKSINRRDQQVILTYKELLGTWEENVEKIKEGQILPGIVREKEKNRNGIFIELMPNLIGLAEYRENLNYGTKVKVYVKKIQKEKKKIKLIVIE